MLTSKYIDLKNEKDLEKLKETVGVRMPSGTNIKNIIKSFDGQVDYLIDGGESKIGIASTIVQVIDGEVHILREGSITKEQIEKLIN